MRKYQFWCLVIGLFVLIGHITFAAGDGEQDTSEPVTLTIATVNNPDMKIMQELSGEFTEQTGIELEWSVLPENELRQKVMEDVGLGSGSFDVVTIGILEVKNWVQFGWISALDDFFENQGAEVTEAYNYDDIIESVREGLSIEDVLYALPFYAETSMIYYRKDLFKDAGLTMPEEPSWDQIYDLASQLHSPENDQYGMILRGLPGWGENMAVFGTIINAFGARWYDENWQAQFDTTEMRNAFEGYYNLIKDVCQPGATGTGFTEGLTLMAQGNGAIWYDASVAAGLLNDPTQSQVVGKLGYARAPWQVKHNNGWLWSWALAIESVSDNKEEAFEFIQWATSRDYINLVGETKGWVTVPSGSRESTYENPKYMEVADFAPMVVKALKAVDYNHPSMKATPYIGTPFVVIPEWPKLGSEVAQILAAYISDTVTLDEALDQCQKIANEVAVDGGYR